LKTQTKQAQRIKDLEALVFFLLKAGKHLATCDTCGGKPANYDDFNFMEDNLACKSCIQDFYEAEESRGRL
jgi:hypothetical protein